MNQLSRFGMLSVMLVAMACGGADSSDPTPAQAPTVRSEEAPKGVEQNILQKALVTPVTGTVDGTPFSGVLRVTQFVAQGNQILAVSKITSVTGVGAAAATALEGATYRLPVAFPQQQGTVTNGNVGSASAALLPCDILFLQLGPLDLDLLGLVVHLDQVTLDINGETGAGDLLGNLLCAITGLLDPVSFLTNILQIVGLLNQIIDLIGEL